MNGLARYRLKWRLGRGYQHVLRIMGGRHVAVNAIACVIAAIFVGTVSVVYSYVFRAAEQVSLNGLQDIPAYLFVPLSGACFLLSFWICQRFAPLAAGGGVSQVLAAVQLSQEKNDPHEVRQLLSSRVGTVKIFSSLLATLGGSALGREGPTVQICAGIFATFARRLKKYEPSIDLQTWLIAGSAAGVGAAFNTPLGGIVFAIEELTSRHYTRLRTYVLVAVIAAGMTAQGFLGPYLVLGYPNIGSFGLAAVGGLVLTATLAGVVAQMLQFMVQFGNRWRATLDARENFFLAGACGLIVGLICVRYGFQVMGGGTEQMSQLLYNREHEVRLMTLVARIFTTFVAAISGVAGGILAPALTLGSYLGSVLSDVLLPRADHNFVVISGMVAFLAASLRAPFTSIVLVVEMTDRHSSVFPIMMAAVIGYAAALGTERALSPGDAPPLAH